MELPDLIMMDILSRLPAKSIFSCRRVCKSWRNILLDPHFAKLHLSRAPVDFLLKSEGTVFLAELDEESCISNSDVHLGRKSLMSCKTCNGINIGLKEIELCSSCEGMLCVRRSKRWSPYHVYNPITGEHVVVQQTVRASFMPIDCALGFSRRANEFKVMRFLVVTQSRTIVKGLEVDIQTVGSNSWRSIGETPYWPHLSSISSPFLNGALHWICYAAQMILSFDFDEEHFQPIPTPSQHFDNFYHTVGLGSLEGRLCMCYHKPHSTDPLDIWVMNNYGVKESWTKQFVIDKIIDAFPFQPIRYMNNGEILVLCGHHAAICYNPLRRSSRYIKFDSSKSTIFALPHIPSFIKLQK
ncbi:hypothetical protein RJ639_011420 [Escallonia herrerae]|uniref:F-box domain-containing protein n=1 Tax=Escallonia herrerae TaxID=1293975 RepID=A0AA88VUM7_9ASTE|nr:hypothetical protein RJ639_011420 [Escallonia herrerae]